jgi:hypothetical protein
MDNQTLIFGISILTVVLIAVLFSKQVKAFLGSKGFEIETNNPTVKTNEINVKGNNSTIKQDVNSELSEKSNKISLEGDGHQIEQDVK